MRRRQHYGKDRQFYFWKERLINAGKQNSYSFLLVLPKNYQDNSALKQDYDGAIQAGIPIMLVDNVHDFLDGLNQLETNNNFVKTLVFSQHANKGYFKIGNEILASGKKDMAKMKLLNRKDYLKLLITLFCLSLFSCNQNEGYENFESFNYFNLKGEDSIKSMFPKKPYLGILFRMDTFIIKTYYENCPTNNQIWIKTKNFWYNESCKVFGSDDVLHKSEENIEKRNSYLYKDSLVIFSNTFLTRDSTWILGWVSIKKPKLEVMFQLSYEIKPDGNIDFENLLKYAEGEYVIKKMQVNNDTLEINELSYSSNSRDSYVSRFVMNGISPFFIDDDCVLNQVKFLGKFKL